MQERRLVRILAGIAAAALVSIPGGAALARDEAKPLYAATIDKYPAPKLAQVSGREYKALFDPARLGPDAAAAFQDLWGRIRAGAERQGFQVSEKGKSPLAIEQSTKEYFDTKDQALWSKGYLVRVTTRYKDGKPGATVSVTVKSMFEDAERTLAAPLTVVGVEKSKTEAEDNVGFGPDGRLRGHVEKGSSFSVPLASLGAFTLGDFAKFVPELLGVGLAADTPLVAARAYAARVRPGQVVLPGARPCGVSMEAWSRAEGERPFLYDFSFGCEDLDFYAVGPSHAAGESFMAKVVRQELGSLLAPDSGNWGGSKVRQMMNRPLPGAPN